LSNEYQQYVERIVNNWQEKQREGALTIIQKYGYPQEATTSRLIWYNNGPWKRTIVHRDAVPHNFPTTHPDFLEQTIDYKTPVGLFDTIAMFDGSIYPDRTKGEVSAVCDKEPMNFLSINLLNDIVCGKRTVHDARSYYAETAARFIFQGISSPYIEGLLFQPQRHTADPDIRYF
jgi:hypothetical protein